MMTETNQAAPESLNAMMSFCTQVILKRSEELGLKISGGATRFETMLNDPATRPICISVEFVDEDVDGVGTHVNMYVDRTFDRKFRENDAGDVMMDSTYEVKLNYPAHGSLCYEDAIHCFDFFQKVALLAKTIHEQVDGKVFETLYSTKAEKDKNNAETKERNSNRAYEAAILENCKGIRLGGNERQFNLTPAMVPFTGDRFFVIEKNNIKYTYKMNLFGGMKVAEFWLVSKGV